MNRKYGPYFLFVLVFIAVQVFAAAPTWDVLRSESKITFTGTQNDSPISGEFKKFTGEITGDLDQLDKSKVKIIIDINSLSVSFKELEDTLKSPDWFDVRLFPEAIFIADQFKKIDDKTYEAKGTLTIRNKKLPLNVMFNIEEHTKDRAKVQGSASIKRTAYEVGKGEWGNTDEVKDDVIVNFNLTAVKK